MDGPSTLHNTPDRSSPVTQLVTALLGGTSVLVTGATGTDSILSAATPMLSGTRTRVLQPRSSNELVAFMNQALPSNAASETAGVEYGFNALTVLDPSCDRIALLVANAHLLSKDALDYVDFALRAAPHLQVALAGQPTLIDTLAHENFARLRKRIKLHLVPLAPLPTPDAPLPIRRDLGNGSTGGGVGSGATTPPPASMMAAPRPLFFTEHDADGSAGLVGRGLPNRLPRSRNKAWVWGGVIGVVAVGLATLPFLDSLTGADYVSKTLQALAPHRLVQLATRSTPAASVPIARVPVARAPVIRPPVAQVPAPPVAAAPVSTAPAVEASRQNTAPFAPKLSGQQLPPNETGPIAIWEPEMVTLPEGTFRMGGNDDPSERPVHAVTVQSFLLAKHATTVNEWQLCVEAKVCTLIPTGEPDEPVTNISWDDARQFIQWLSETTGQRYRLPTEAEWEYAARAGTETRYPWGNTMQPGKASCKGCGNPISLHSPPLVRAYPPNSFGFYGMSGGVAEWVADCWHRDYQGAPHDASKAWDAPDCRQRVLRGGSWVNEANSLRASSREFYDASVRYPTHGFRVAWSE